MINNIKSEYFERLKKHLSENEYNLYLNSLNDEETHGMTINYNKLKNSSIDLDYLIKRFNLKEVFNNKDYGYYIYDKAKLSDILIYPGKDPLYYVGLYYIQEPSAAEVLSKVEINPSDIVLDLCASPGGKSIQALYTLKSEEGGFLVSNEIDNKRVKVLNSNIERMGFDNFIILSENTEKLANRFNNYFDKIIIDAPCSGEGMFRKSTEAVNQWSTSLISHCSKIQKDLLKNAYSMLKNGGTLIYSTCTFSNEEDEDNVQYILNSYKDLELVKMKKNYPFNSIGEGQFYAIMKKNGDLDTYKTMISKKDFNGLKIIRYGIKESDDLENGKPSHAFSHSDKAVFENIVDLDDYYVYKYLKGETIKMELPFTGFCKVTYKKLGLGIAKYVNGVLKNHYPKGLRIY